MQSEILKYIFSNQTVNNLIFLIAYQINAILAPSDTPTEYVYQMSSIILLISFIILVAVIKNKFNKMNLKSFKSILLKELVYAYILSMIIISPQLQDKSTYVGIKCFMVGRLLQSRKISRKEQDPQYRLRNKAVVFFGFLYIATLIGLVVLYDLFPLNDQISFIALLTLEWILKTSMLIIEYFRTKTSTVLDVQNMKAISPIIKNADQKSLLNSPFVDENQNFLKINSGRFHQNFDPPTSRNSVKLSGYNNCNSLMDIVFYYFQEGLIVLSEDQQIVLSSQASLKITNSVDQEDCFQFLMTLRNCQEDYQKQNQSFFYRSSEQDQQNDQDQFSNSYEKIESINIRNLNKESNTVLEYFQKIVQLIKENGKIDSSSELQGNLLCSKNGLMKYENEQGYQQSQKIFQILIRPFYSDQKLYYLFQFKDATYLNYFITLQNLNQNRTNMVMWVSHEFRTPLTSIILLIDTLISESSQEIVEKFLNPVLTAANALLSLIHDMLDFAQIRVGKFTLQYEEFSIVDLLEDIKSLLTPNLKLKGNQIIIEADKEIPKKIISDPKRIRQILINLIGNSSKFTDKGIIRITANIIKQGYLSISVEDNGIGIPLEYQRQIFQAYKTLDHGKYMNRQGVGLGLTISNILAEKLSQNLKSSSTDVLPKRGLKVYSPAPNQEQGTRFSFVVCCIYFFYMFKNFQDIQNEQSIKTNYIPIQSDLNKMPSFKVPSETKIIQNPLHTLKNILDSQNKAPINQQGTSSFNINSNDLNPIPIGFNHKEENEISESSLNPFSDSEYPKGAKESREIKCLFRQAQEECQCPEILIVDDQPINLLAMKAVLKKYNKIVHSAQSGKEAIEKVSQFNCPHNKMFTNYKLILMDLEMPIMDGYETCQEILKFFPKLKIVGLTGHSSQLVKSKCLNLGMKNVITKPITNKQLKDLLDNIDGQEI